MEAYKNAWKKIVTPNPSTYHEDYDFVDSYEHNDQIYQKKSIPYRIPFCNEFYNKRTLHNLLLLRN